MLGFYLGRGLVSDIEDSLFINKMRVGRRKLRTLYLHRSGEDPENDILIGLVDTPELAAEIVKRWNNARPS